MPIARSFLPNPTGAPNNTAGGFLSDLANAANGMLYPQIVPVFPVVDSPVTELLLPDLETLVPLEFPEPPDTTLDSTGVEFELPVFSATAPEFTPGTAPDFPSEAIPPAPGLNVISAGSAPYLNLPQVPELMTINTIAFGGITLPTFDGVAPTVTLVEPQLAVYTPGPEYSSTLLTRLKDSLLERITGGTTGLAPEVEQALWDRATERELRTVAQAIDDLDRMEAQGFSLPTGVYLDSRIKIQTEFGKTRAGLSRDVAIKQAELTLDNVKQALGLSVNLEQQLLTFANETEQRVFGAAKYSTEGGVQIYNAKVQAFGTLMEAYKTTVTVYEARIRGELAKVEVFKAQIEAERAKADANQSVIASYKVQVDASLAQVEVFKANVQAAGVQAQIEGLKVNMYGEQVRAFAAKTNTFTARVEAYKAQQQAESIKQEAYKTSVQAFSAQVDAVARGADVKIAVIKSQIEQRGLLIEGYKAKVQAIVGGAQALASQRRGQADIYTAQVGAQTSSNELLVKKWQVALEQSQRVAEIGVSAAKANADLYVSIRAILADAAKVAAQVAAQLGAAALNQYNFSNSISASDSTSDSSSVSTSTNTNTNVNL